MRTSDDQFHWGLRTIVAAVIERDSRFLIVEEKVLDGLRLNTPGGHLEPGESLIQGCAREVLEETAWSFTPTALLGIYLHRLTSSQGKDLTYLRFCFTGDLGEHFAARVLDEGVVRAVWMSYEEIVQTQAMHRTPLLLKGIDDYRLGQSYPLEILSTNATVYAS